MRASSNAVAALATEYAAPDGAGAIPWRSFAEFWPDVFPPVKSDAQREAVEEHYEAEIYPLVFDARKKDFASALVAMGEGKISGSTARNVVNSIHARVYLHKGSRLS